MDEKATAVDGWSSIPTESAGKEPTQCMSELSHPGGRNLGYLHIYSCQILLEPTLGVGR